jgi:Na+-transporting NADH:ubiquinone oxidoreductase subunit NqrC
MMMLFILAISMIVAMMFAAIILMIEESASRRLDNQKSVFDLRSVRRVARGTRSKRITHA